MAQEGTIPLEYCALRYAEFWFGTERGIVEELHSPSRNTRIAALAQGASYFRVARTLPRAADLGRGLARCEPVLEILERPGNRWGAGRERIELVTTVRDQLGAVYGGLPLSAASKFLWLRHRDPFAIYDSQARTSLGTPEGDYPEFVARWEDSYQSMREGIREACRPLPLMRRYLSVGHRLSEPEVAAAVEEEWFARRVHDIFLWEAGRSSAPSVERHPPAGC